MSNVISLNTRKEVEFLGDVKIQIPKTGVDYLFLCKQFLTIEDYEEILLSIMDEEYYKKADVQLQAIVDGYFKFDK